MIIFPNAKVNLGLNIISKRADGFHNIESFFFPVQLEDALEFVIADKFEINFSGLRIEGNSADNLIVKTYQLLKRDFDLPNLKIHLHKHIPMGAGLGGGSADAAFFLKTLNNYFKLDISEEKLLNYAAQIGSDCSFFVLNKPCLATKRGENLSPIDFKLSSKKILLIQIIK